MASRRRAPNLTDLDLRSPGPPGPPTSAYPWFVLFEPVPLALRRNLRTVDLQWRPTLDPEPAGLELIEAAVPSVREIERASRGQQQGAPETSRLAFIETVNDVTGIRGIVIHRQRPDGSLSRPLGELLAPSTDLTPETKWRADRLAWVVRHSRPLLVAYRVPRSPDPGAVFLGEQTEDSGDVRFQSFARVFTTAFEIAQWSAEIEPADEADDAIN